MPEETSGQPAISIRVDWLIVLLLAVVSIVLLVPISVVVLLEYLFYSD